MKRDLGQRRIQVPFSLYNVIKEMFYTTGPKLYSGEKTEKKLGEKGFGLGRTSYP